MRLSLPLVSNPPSLLFLRNHLVPSQNSLKKECNCAGDELRKLISIPKSRIGLAIPLLQMVCAFLGKRIIKSNEPVQVGQACIVGIKPRNPSSGNGNVGLVGIVIRERPRCRQRGMPLLDLSMLPVLCLGRGADQSLNRTTAEPGRYPAFQAEDRISIRNRGLSQPCHI